MKYNYDSEIECFVREDGHGKKFHINSSEAQRVVTMRDLGYSAGKICAKINFRSGKVYESTINNFLKNVDNGDIIVDKDYPAPKSVVEDLTVSDRITRLEERLSELEEIVNIEKSSWSDKVRAWLVQ